MDNEYHNTSQNISKVKIVINCIIYQITQSITMTAILQDQKSWLRQHSSEDLSRTLVREYLYQHNLFKTLSCFQTEDKENSKKIVKSTLIKMLCINNLVVNNKKMQKEKQSKSLLLMLVQYLRGKFQERIFKQNSSQQMSYKNQNDFSMNGDRLLTQEIMSGNIIKEKNLVNTKKNQNQKTLTQEAFYKKKDSNQQEIKLVKRSTNAIKQQKKPSQVRPNTANPHFNPKTQQQKISAIYSKLNTQTGERKDLIRQEEQDPMLVQLNNLVQGKKQSLQGNVVDKSKNVNSNSAFGKNNKLQSSSNTRQLRQQKNLQEKQLNDLPLDSNITDRYFEQKQKQPNTQPFLEENIPISSQNFIAKAKEEKQLPEQYFEEFEEEKVQEKAHQKIKVEEKFEKKAEEKPKEKFEEKVKQVTNSSKPNQQLGNKVKPQFIAIPIQVQQFNETDQFISKSSKNPQPELKSDRSNKFIQPQTKVINNEQSSYTPTVAVNRGGMKLMRKVAKQFIKEEDATEMIGNDIKLLPDDAKFGQEPVNKVISSFKVQQTQQRQTSHLSKEFMIQKKDTQTKPQTASKDLITNSQQQLSATTMRQIKLKKKVKNFEQEEPKISSKFKFDQNFVDQPLNAHKEKYNYERFTFEKITIKPELKPQDAHMVLENKINYIQKPNADSSGSTNPYSIGISKKKNQKPLSNSKGEQLKKIIFQKGNHYLPKAWHQGFILSPFAQTFHGLKQIQGGPCGIIAAVQCYFLKHLMYLSKPASENDLKNQTRRQNCLVAALADILWKAKGSNDKIILAIPTNRNFSGLKLQFSSLTEIQLEANSFQSVYESLWGYKSSFIGQSNHGVTAIIYSIVMTKGIQKIYNQVDMRQNPLIGHHGHCTQELVNLFITGQAVSNCFDGKKVLEDDFTLNGVDRKSEFGFLTVFETLGYIEVGKNLKNPIFPIWIISKEFHYHVIFGNHYLIGQNDDCQKFDLIYFDGLYTCDKFIRLTFDEVQKDEFGMVKDNSSIKNLPLIEQVLLKKWGRRKVDWNGSIKIL